MAGLVAVTMRGAEAPLVTSVYAKTRPDYHRQKLPDGSLKPEYYVIARGKYEPGTAHDESIDKVQFPQIAGLVAQHLAEKKYFLAPKAEQADFLLLVTWGTTIPYDDPNRTNTLTNLSSAVSTSRSAMSTYKSALAAASQMQGQGSTTGQELREAEAAAYSANDALEGQLLQAQMAESDRRKVNERNAALLGYVDEVNNRDDASRVAGAGAAFDELITDLETERYYITVAAIDFKKLQQDGKQDILWRTVVSVEARRQRFDEALALMVASAGRRFGEDSGLVRKPQEGSVTYGELKVLGTTPAATDAPQEKK